MTSALFDLWSSTYNAPDSALPFLLPFGLWFSCWAYCKSNKMDYARWYSLHTLHHLGAIAHGMVSLYFDDDAIFNERIVILWSMPYFMVDIVDCIVEKHLTYAIHAVLCLGLGIANYSIPVHRLLRMNSKATFIECSSPVFYQVKQHREPYLFVIFAIIFTCCRIIWIPFMIKTLRDEGLPWTNPSILGVFGFYLLNWFWYAKIVNILITGGKDTKEHKKTPTDESKKE